MKMTVEKTLESSKILERIVLQEKEAKKFGFYWESADQILAQIRSECSEIKEAIEKQDLGNLKEEIGDLMSATVSLCIFLSLDPIETLDKNVEKFQRRYDVLTALVKQDNLVNLQEKTVEVLLSYWDRAKKITAETKD